MCNYQLVGYSASGNLVVNFRSLRRSRIVRCQFFGLYPRWTLCGVPICGSALYFVFRVTISAFISRIHLCSWSVCALFLLSPVF